MRRLDYNGFIHTWLVRYEAEDYVTDIRDDNQLRLEGKLRAVIAAEHPDHLTYDELSGWKGFYQRGAIFVSVSDFFPTLHRISMGAASTLVCEAECEKELVIWTYMAAVLYVNGEKCCVVDKPRYKPIEKACCRVKLKAGRNDILLVLDNLGVRDTRNMVALQVVDGSELYSGIPDRSAEEDYLSVTSFLDGIEVGDTKAVFSCEAPKGTLLIPHGDSLEYQASLKDKKIDISGLSSIELPSEKSFTIRIGEFSRTFENSRLFVPSKSLDTFRSILESVADTRLLNRGSHGFASFYLLAMKALGREIPDEEALIDNDFELIHERVDCSDFLVTMLLRYHDVYGFSPETEKKFREVLLDYRYWMNMEGADGMCFWSENHALMFWFAAYRAGQILPEGYFHRAGMKGSELSLWGRERIVEWLDDVIANGYEEFESCTYSLVTLAVLLSVYDFTDSEIKAKAKKAIDDMMNALAIQTFKGSVISPMGRVYRDVIRPFASGVQSLISAIDPSAPYSPGEGWVVALATTGYEFAPELVSVMHTPCNIQRYEGNAAISTEKGKDYILTAVDTSLTRDVWTNCMNDGTHSAGDPIWVKSLNECFHGTTRFRSGEYGYQQHMWSAALSPDTLVFANHPGDTYEDTELRPGYWNGNGIMPAVKKLDGAIASLFVIDDHPVSFTHLYFPEAHFDSVVKEGNWIFAAKGAGVIGIWASHELVPYDSMLHGVELRAYSERCAYLVFASQDIPLAEYAASLKERRPVFDEDKLTLSLDGEEILRFTLNRSGTQLIE